MVDLSPALEVFTRRRAVALDGAVADPDDVLERAAFLEYCEGLDRRSADKQALKEFGFESWDALALVGSPDRLSEISLEMVNAIHHRRTT